jgi:hypothetical protein
MHARAHGVIGSVGSQKIFQRKKLVHIFRKVAIDSACKHQLVCTMSLDLAHG